MFNLRIYYLFIPALLFLIQPTNWELQKNTDGIKVYTTPNQKTGYNSFKAVMELNVASTEVVQFLKCIDEHPNAFPDTKEIRILKRPNDSTQIQYSRTKAPWPVSDRDGIYKLVFHTNKKTGVVKSVGKALPNYLPPVKDVVRIPSSDTYWIVTPLNPFSCRLEYIVSAELGGSIPLWLANSAVVDLPFRTFQNIRSELTATKK